MKKIVYNVDICNACFKGHAACAQVQSDKEGLSCRKMKRVENPVTNSFRLITESCRHWEDPTCWNNCAHDVFSVDPITGFVITNDENCIGCQICSFVCPFDVPKNDENCIGCQICSFVCPFDVPKFLNEKIVKCDGCNDRVKAGLLPACVEACESHALRLIDCK